MSPEIKDKICEQLASGRSLRSILDDDGMPASSAVFRELSLDKLFQEQYARAREAQADALFDEIQEIADDARNDWMERREDRGGGYELNGEHVQRSRLRIDARKWMAGKLRPKKYGDSMNIDGEMRVGLIEGLKAVRGSS